MKQIIVITITAWLFLLPSFMPLYAQEKSVAAYIQTLSPGAEIFVSATVTNQKYNGFQRFWYTFENNWNAETKIQACILRITGKHKIENVGWSIFPGIKGRYADLKTGKCTAEDTYLIVLNDLSLPLIEEIATELCKSLRQDCVLIHDLNQNTYRVWGLTE